MIMNGRKKTRRMFAAIISIMLILDLIVTAIFTYTIYSAEKDLLMNTADNHFKETVSKVGKINSMYILICRAINVENIALAVIIS